MVASQKDTIWTHGKLRSCSSPSASWRFCVAAGAVSSFIVCVINLAITVWGALKYDIDRKGQGVVLEGQCSVIRKYNIVIHLAINAFATILLSASNYCMQCLSAPTRGEIDRAHAKKIWLDIGVPSFRNLQYISKKRVMMWCLLAITSLPLHLFYNSTYYSSSAVNDYKAIIFRPNSSAPRNASIPTDLLALYDNAKAGKLEALDVKQCISEYRALSFHRGNVALAVDEAWANSSQNLQSPFNSTERIVDILAFNVSAGASPLHWICDQPSKRLCNPDKLGTTNWKVNGWRISNCFSERTEERCKIFFSLPLAIAVIVANGIKVLVFGMSLLEIRHDPLLCAGDAIANFMRAPDSTTKGMCMAWRKDFGHKRQPWKATPVLRVSGTTPRRWSKALSRRVRVHYLFPILGGLSACLFLVLFTVGYAQNFDLPLMLGFGSVDLRALISVGASGVVGKVLFANIGQAFLSVFYVSYNGILTSYLLSYEWNQYSQYRKGLRVSSDPQGSQRSTYFLQLPYRFSIPFQVVWAGLHWLISQSIYLVSLEKYQTTGSPNNFTFHVAPSNDEKGDNQILACGYSPVGLGATFCCGLAALLCLKYLSRRVFAGSMPIAGSCSAAMSAGCHVSDDEPADAALKPVKWGVVSSRRDGIGHCSFSSLEVEDTTPGRYYS